MSFDRKETQFNREQAIAFLKSGIWREWTKEQIANFQLRQDRLCIPFGIFHEATEKALGRPVWTHEFGEPQKLLLELEGLRKQPTLAEIFSRIPKDKLILVIKP